MCSSIFIVGAGKTCVVLFRRFFGKVNMTRDAKNMLVETKMRPERKVKLPWNRVWIEKKLFATSKNSLRGFQEFSTFAPVFLHLNHVPYISAIFSTFLELFYISKIFYSWNPLLILVSYIQTCVATCNQLHHLLLFGFFVDILFLLCNDVLKFSSYYFVWSLFSRETFFESFSSCLNVAFDFWFFHSFFFFCFDLLDLPNHHAPTKLGSDGSTSFVRST